MPATTIETRAKIVTLWERGLSYRQVAAEVGVSETNGRLAENINLAISPYTVWVAMSIVNEGAMRNTAAQLESTLYIPPNNGTDRDAFRRQQQRLVQQITKSQEGVTLEILNSMFTKKEAILKPKFIELVQDIYNVKVEPLDFHQPAIAADRINSVISEATHGKITEIVDADKVSEAYMFITSVLYFKGLWDKKFDKDDTKPEPFYNERKEKIATVQMMHTKGAFPFGQILNGKAIAVELPYVGNNIAMFLILPSSSATLSSVLHELSETYSQVVNHFNEITQRYGNSNVVIKLPKFKISSDLKLVEALQNMGIKDAFSISLADLTGISPEELYVSNVLHKTEIEVDEEGTTGAAVTVVEIMDKAGYSSFNANKPFAFMVVDKVTKTVLFTGTGQRVSMILIRPRQDKKSLTMILNELVETSFTKVYTDIHKDDDLAMLLDDMIEVYLPRFEISTIFNMNLILDVLGIKDLFNENDADLENIAPNIELYVSRIMHHAKIQVDEEGTTASSATGVETENKMKSTVFRADRSFLFLLYDKDTKSILFTGKYATPN
ncbi:serine protease inhibitor serpin [Holotrichia oblita]|uniref:Serine protease inhibitor serpin n=1 Tax=Holotrichia oblita TaxID=644536 RepID=A0ACB9TCC4_HOLOL|nr:serine protease inhibitor serpin [Holotrichia oblita]